MAICRDSDRTVIVKFGQVKVSGIQFEANDPDIPDLRRAVRYLMT